MSRPVRGDHGDIFKNRKITTLLATGIVARGTGAGVAQAKHSADDPAGHQRHSQTEAGDDHGRKTEAGDDHSRKTEAGDDHSRRTERGDHHGRKAKAKNDHRRTARETEHRHGNDDGPGHR